MKEIGKPGNIMHKLDTQKVRRQKMKEKGKTGNIKH